MCAVVHTQVWACAILFFKNVVEVVAEDLSLAPPNQTTFSGFPWEDVLEVIFPKIF